MKSEMKRLSAKAPKVGQDQAVLARRVFENEKSALGAARKFFARHPQEEVIRLTSVLVGALRKTTEFLFVDGEVKYGWAVVRMGGAS